MISTAPMAALLEVGAMHPCVYVCDVIAVCSYGRLWCLLLWYSFLVAVGYVSAKWWRLIGPEPPNPLFGSASLVTSVEAGYVDVVIGSIDIKLIMHQHQNGTL